MNSSKLTSKMDFSGHNIYVGMDVHKKNWNISIYVDDVFYKSFQQAPNAGQLETYLKENFSGASYRCAYEAGFCGFWIQRELSHRGISCIVVNPADIPSKDKDRKRKTDKLDSKRIACNLGARQLEPIYIYRVRLLRETVGWCVFVKRSNVTLTDQGGGSKVNFICWA